jgi:ferric-dicitrate binding protein FerR (iron transport regulator)
MTGESRSAVCERARAWASLLPDGELSLFERRLLDAHCVRCSECRRLRADVASLTTIVRGTPLDEMARPVRVPSARLRSWRPASGVLASGGVAALAFVLAVWIGPQAHTGRTTTQVVSAPPIILIPEQLTDESQAIWNLKRSRGAAENAGAAHRTGLVLT